MLPQVCPAIESPLITKDLRQSADGDNYDCVPGAQARQLDVALHGGIGDSHSTGQIEPRAFEFDRVEPQIKTGPPWKFGRFIP